MEAPHSFGTWLKRHRKALDLTQAALADRVGCSAAAIRKFEAEERTPSVQIANRLAEIFDIPASEQPAFVKFARGDPRISIREITTGTAPWRPSLPAPRSNIPLPPTPLIGRQPDMDMLLGYLSNPEIRLLTVVGAPGIGKTRLALELARAAIPSFSDGVFFIPLAPLEDPALIYPTIFQTLGYVEPKNRVLLQQLLANIGDKQILLVLDNCEHLVDAVAQFVPEILSACPHLKLALTSREALRLPGEWHYVLPVLGVPQTGAQIDLDAPAQYPALALFADRARAVRSDFTLNPENIQAVAAICMHLDGLPLAIELIAARIRLMSPQALLERLNDLFVLSADGMRALSARQKTLNDAIQWSYNLLSQDEQRLFACLSVFSGGFSLEAAEDICAPLLRGRSVPNLVALLFDKSLLERAIDERGEVRFSMLVTLQQFAQHCLQSAGDEASLRDQHLAYFLRLAEDGEQAMRGPHQIEWGNRLECELDNFRAALEWCVASQKAEPSLRILKALGWPWEVQGHYCEMRGWFERIRSLPKAAHPSLVYVQVLNHLGRQTWSQEDFCEARIFLTESQGMAVSLGGDGELILADTLNWLGLLTLFPDRDHASAQAMFEQSLGIYEKWENRHGVALSTFHLGILHNDQGNNALAHSLLEKSLSLFELNGDLFFIARVSLFLGYELLGQGNVDQALSLFEQQLRLDQQLKFWDGIADGWRNVGYLYYSQHKYEEARQYIQQSVIVSRQHGLKKYDTFLLSGLLALHQQDFPQALQYFEYQLDALRWSEEKRGSAALFTGLAAAAAGAGQPERAARLVGAARSSREASRQSPEDQALLDTLIEIARQQLGAEKFEKLVEEGEAMTLDQAFTYALNTRSKSP